MAAGPDAKGSRRSPHFVDSQARPSAPFWMDTDSFPYPASDVERIVRASFGAWEAVSTSYLEFDEQNTGTFQGTRSDGRSAILYDE